MRGRFITLEGGEGVGKSTQLRAVALRLEAAGISVVTTREPGGSGGAESIRALLLDTAGDGWGPRAEACLFAAARSDHVERLILPAITRGDWVLCDRYVDSSRAYQGGRDGLTDTDILALHALGSRGLMPDRTCLLVLDEQALAERRRHRSVGPIDRFEQRDLDYHRTVNATFRSLASEDAERFRIIDAGCDEDAVTGAIMASLADLLP